MLLLCKDTFTLDYNLCLYELMRFQRQKTKAFIPKWFVSIFGYRSEWSKFPLRDTFRTKRKKVFLERFDEDYEGFLLSSFHSSDVFPTSQKIVFTPYSFLCSELFVPACVVREDDIHTTILTFSKMSKQWKGFSKDVGCLLHNDPKEHRLHISPLWDQLAFKILIIFSSLKKNLKKKPVDVWYQQNY